jgi:hypothetical protein
LEFESFITITSYLVDNLQKVYKSVECKVVSKNVKNNMSIIQGVVMILFFVNAFIFIFLLIILILSKKIMYKYAQQIDKTKKISNDYMNPSIIILLIDFFAGFYLYKPIIKDQKYYLYPEFVRIVGFINKIKKIVLRFLITFIILLIGVFMCIPIGRKKHAGIIKKTDSSLSYKIS